MFSVFFPQHYLVKCPPISDQSVIFCLVPTYVSSLPFCSAMSLRPLFSIFLHSVLLFFERWSNVKSHFGVFPDGYFQPTGNGPEILILLPLREREPHTHIYCIPCPSDPTMVALGSALFIFPCISVSVNPKIVTPHCLSVFRISLYLKPPNHHASNPTSKHQSHSSPHEVKACSPPPQI